MRKVYRWVENRSMKCRKEDETSVRVILCYEMKRGWQMQSRRLEKPEAYSPELVEDVFELRATRIPAEELPQENGPSRIDS
jgi:hypothetical protein